MVFDSEKAFEDAVIDRLGQYGWDDEGGVLNYPTEQDLIDNWAEILFHNNKQIDKFNGCRLTAGEMAQIIEQVIALRTPLALNGFINGKSVAITRDNPDDKDHFGKEVSLKIFDRAEIAGGQSRYQIARQPVFPAKNRILNSRRGDLMLLINGMPVIHIELKKSGVSVKQAANQIEKYSHEHVFTGLFSLVQVFVAMTPEETLYFANPGTGSPFNSHYFFHWEDFNNEPVNNWADVVESLLSIPMAHQLIGFYTVADDSDGALKVMRSYQYFAASRISDRVTKINRDKAWGTKGVMGGYVWHTTGSGKTMTSFKSAQLIANSKDADKVVFLVDRIELGTQSLEEYRSFADESDAVQQTENTDVLKAKMKSDDPADTLIVTSIQKMSNIRVDSLQDADLEKMRSKRIVFIVDECHRSTFGEMLLAIREAFPAAVFFGFTGTPIHEENQKKANTTADVFGPELHRYSIADGIRDKNVLGFDPDMVLTFKDKDVRKQVALHEAKAEDLDEVSNDPAKSKVFYYFMDASKVDYAGSEDDRGQYHRGIEDYLPEVQYGMGYEPPPAPHQVVVVDDIKEQWTILSHNGKFHAIFATHSIPEAIEYYKLMKERAPEIKVTALFDPNIDNRGNVALAKEDGLVEILKDYNERYGQEFGLANHGLFKKDVAARLAHKRPYINLENHPEDSIDILIVVDQMLTGFDSKWINTLYLDKVLKYEMVIQAFSRTNRLFRGDEKPHGVIRYYRRPHTMKRNIADAVKLYSGDKPFGLFVEKLEGNLFAMNRVFEEIRAVFEQEGIVGFAKLPESVASRGKFASLFKELNALIESARLQGFTWEKTSYEIEKQDEALLIEVLIEETDFMTLAQRYKELGEGEQPGSGPVSDVPYEIEGYLTEIDTGFIDAQYMNANFEKWLKVLESDGQEAEATKEALAALHRSFASLTQEEQKYAGLLIRDAQSGDMVFGSGKSFRDYVTDYQRRGKTDQVERTSAAFGIDAKALMCLISEGVTEDDINEFGRFDKLMETLDLQRAIDYFEQRDGERLPAFRARVKADNLLRSFVLSGGFDL